MSEIENASGTIENPTTMIKNPKGMHGVIVHDETETLKMVFPDEIEAIPGEFVEWVVEPSHLSVTVTFDPRTGSPFTWDSEKSAHGKITGVVARDAKGFYEYSVTDDKNHTIDPRMRIKR